MLVSHYLLATVKEIPADAELISHRLMLRAGMIRKLASGLYTWLPLGLKVLQKIEAIVRAEMNASGALEILMPSVHPAELWQESARWEKYGAELLRFTDRHHREFCYGPTHEEVVTDVARRELKSYKQLPVNFYQMQTKFRDEIRPRFGVMRAREFMMKDAYSFDIDMASMQRTYQKMYDTYTKIFTRLGLKFRAVLADTGSIGGSFSHEFQVLANSGEDLIVYSDGSDYAANIEKAEAKAPTEKRASATQALKKVATPNVKTIQQLCNAFKIKAADSVKTLIAKNEKNQLVALVLRGDHELNEIKAAHLKGMSDPLQLANEEEVRQALGCGFGSLGVVNLAIPFVVDRDAAQLIDFSCGANEEGFHYFGVNWERDIQLQQVADIRKVCEGDTSPDGKGTLRFARGIEVGHVFQLGTRYSDQMNCLVLNEQGKSVPLVMGCYGLGISRVVAAAIEQNHDEFGIVWPMAMAPFHVALIPMKMHKSADVHKAVMDIYQQLTAVGVEVLLDDRDERPGVMFADMDLIGIPHRLVIGEKGLVEGQVEYKARADAEVQHIPLKSVVSFLQNKIYR
ncbi:MAG: proline--tRNA ligase [Coxiella sp. RIFCSPHIGHO2_12_FULL_42_15]|nr:MAG: proline--tRNA ligase [Coxiella sp. RIFCSPHIGHO2_12_FULL_42_15]